MERHEIAGRSVAGDLMKRFASYLIRYLLLITPTILMLVALVEFFPYTGLARIAALPAIVVMNSLIIVASFAVPHKGLLSAVLKAVLTIFITLWIAIYFYPQEFSPSVMAQTRDAVRAINNFDNITRDDLNANRNIDNPAYVVALYKYRDEIPLDGTYQLYEHPDVSINSLEEIGSKLRGYHKAIWWYLKTFK